MEFSIRGEMTAQMRVVHPATQEIINNNQHKMEIIEQVARAMNMSSDQEMENIKSVMFPSLLCSVAYIGDISKLQCLDSVYNADWNMTDYTGRTTLHTAAATGNDEVVTWLLERGASVHVRDINNETPLLAAVRAGHKSIVMTLAQCGAHLDLAPGHVADMLVGGAGAGRCDIVQCLLVAGADPNISLSSNGNTALHAATEVCS